jgi:hypothetical protein
MNNEIFSKLFQKKQGPTLHVLIELSHPPTEDTPEYARWRFINNNEDITWKGETYKAVPMSYKPPSSNDGIPSGGSLEIDIDQQQALGSEGAKYNYELLKFFDEADDKTELSVNAVMNKEGDVTELGWLKHRFGTVNWDGQKIAWNPGTDNRLQMQANPWQFDLDALMG